MTERNEERIASGLVLSSYTKSLNELLSLYRVFFEKKHKLVLNNCIAQF